MALTSQLEETGDEEPRQVLNSLVDFIDKHEVSRLVAIGNSASQIPVKNLAGYTRIDPEGAKQYLFSSPGLREALKGLDFKRAIEVLIEKGILPPARADGKTSRLERINGKMTRVYIINYDALIENI
ncbi:hypothetical protein [Candidatus Nitrosoglobus terrae]|nr:hypothetical protein [Candidatus Nitrosoglobus terrae]